RSPLDEGPSDCPGPFSQGALIERQQVIVPVTVGVCPQVRSAPRRAHDTNIGTCHSWSRAQRRCCSWPRCSRSPVHAATSNPPSGCRGGLFTRNDRDSLALTWYSRTR